MDFNQLIYSRLAGTASLVANLAKYNDQPAIFCQEFPPDQQPGWSGKVEYPRIDYQVDMMADPQRASSGLLRCLIYTEKNPLIAEQIEAQVRMSLGDVLMKPSDKAPLCVAWSRTDAYQYEGSAVLVKEVDFDILEYPNQETTDPDPVMALNTYIKELFPDYIVIGLDTLEEITNPSETPVFFCRLGSITSSDGPNQNTISWFQAQISVHVLCSDQSTRMKITGGLNQRLAIDTEVIMLDDSPMKVLNQRMNARADYLREGQLTVTGYYGCLKDGEYKPTLVHGYLNPLN